jgi:dihydrodipicolinate reductase
MSMPRRVLLVGAKGRMGQAVAAAVGQDSGLTIGAAVDRGDAIGPALEKCDQVIDFSAADATPDVAEPVRSSANRSSSAPPVITQRKKKRLRPRRELFRWSSRPISVWE